MQARHLGTIRVMTLNNHIRVTMLLLLVFLTSAAGDCSTADSTTDSPCTPDTATQPVSTEGVQPESTVDMSEELQEADSEVETQQARRSGLQTADELKRAAASASGPPSSGSGSSTGSSSGAWQDSHADSGLEIKANSARTGRL